MAVHVSCRPRTHPSICGVISFPCALWTAFAMPKLPSRAKPNWIFTAEEIEIARRRMPGELKVYTGLFKWRDIVRWHKTWHVWLCTSQVVILTQSRCSSSSSASWASRASRVSCRKASYSSDLLGQELQRQGPAPRVQRHRHQHHPHRHQRHHHPRVALVLLAVRQQPRCAPLAVHGHRGSLRHHLPSRTCRDPSPPRTQGLQMGAVL